MLVWNTNIKKSIPNPCSRIGIIFFIKIIPHNPVGRGIKIHPQALGEIIVDGVLPVKQEISLVQRGNTVYETGRKIDLPEFLLIILPENGRGCRDI